MQITIKKSVIHALLCVFALQLVTSTAFACWSLEAPVIKELANMHDFKGDNMSTYSDPKKSLQLDSIYQYDFTSETDSLLNSRVLYEQNEQGSIIKEVTEFWNPDTEVWIYHSKKEREYNEQQKEIIYISYSWDNANDIWIGNRKEEYDYDDNGYRTLLAIYLWNSNSGSWAGNSRYEYEKNEHGKNTRRITYNWASDNEEWIYKDKWDYEYNEQILNTSWIASLWDSSIDEWVFSWKSEYEYNEFGETAREEYYEWDNANKKWLLLAIDEYEFKENGQTQLWISTYYKSDIEEWVYYSKRDYVYDENDLLVSTLRYNWNVENEKWIKYSKYEYEYDENGFISVEALYLWSIVNKVWTGYRKDEIENNEYGLYTMFIRYSSWDSVNEAWIPTSKSENDFNGGSSWEEIIYSASYYWDSVNKIWIGTSKTVYEKNDLNDISLLKEFEWDSNTNAWVVNSKSFYYYRAIFNVFITINPIDAGSVSGYGSQNSGSEVTLEAIANNGFVFTNWTEGEKVLSEDTMYTFTMPTSDVTLTANFTKITAIHDEGINDQVLIYPVPAKNQINIMGVENIANIEIWTVDGRIVRRGMGNRMDVSQLPDGVYVIKIHAENQIVTRKIMISKQ